MNYEEMSDHEIDITVANLIGVKIEHIEDDIVFVYTYGECEVGAFNPCNNPSDAWPIIVENEISLISPEANGSKAWRAGIFDLELVIKRPINSYNANPLRAAMIVFLMMKENQNEQ